MITKLCSSNRGRKRIENAIKIRSTSTTKIERRIERSPRISLVRATLRNIIKVCCSSLLLLPSSFFRFPFRDNKIPREQLAPGNRRLRGEHTDRVDIDNFRTSLFELIRPARARPCALYSRGTRGYKLPEERPEEYRSLRFRTGAIIPDTRRLATYALMKGWPVVNFVPKKRPPPQLEKRGAGGKKETAYNACCRIESMMPRLICHARFRWQMFVPMDNDACISRVSIFARALCLLAVDTRCEF